MDYAQRFEDAAAELRSLAEQVESAEQRQEAVADQLANAEREVARLDKALEAHRRRAVSQLGGSSDAFAKFQSRLRRLSREHAVAAETVAALTTDVAPRAEGELAAARGELAAELKTVAGAAHRDAETAIHELLSEVLDMRDDYLAAAEALFASHPSAWGSGGRPRVKPARLPPLAVLERARRGAQAGPDPDNRGRQTAESTDGGPGDSQAVPAEKSAD